MPTKLTTNIILLLTAFVTLAGCEPGRGKSSSSSQALTISGTHYRTVIDTFESFSYTWDELDKGIPPLLLDEFPTDIHMIRPVSKKKEFFFQTVLPLALAGNEEVRQQRNAVLNYLDYHDQGKELALHQHEELIKIQRYYKIKGDILHDQSVRERLLERVDIVPPALVLAQAANESGWGLSRFAQKANNIFGEWTFTPGTGLVPKGRPPGETYEVRRFNSLYDSIRSYLRNLNTHRAYRTMRSTRARLRSNNLPLNGYTLAGEMQYYSTRREAYVRELQAIIVGNRLERLNQLTLLDKAVKPAIAPEPYKRGLLSSQEGMSKT